MDKVFIFQVKAVRANASMLLVKGLVFFAISGLDGSFHVLGPKLVYKILVPCSIRDKITAFANCSLFNTCRNEIYPAHKC